MQAKQSNQDAEYRRICKNCGKEIIVSHLAREFCDNNNRCHDQYHSRKKRSEKMTSPLIFPESNHTNAPTQDRMLRLKKNEEFLDSLGIGRYGLILGLEEFKKGDFDFMTFNSRIGSRTIKDAYLVEYGRYIITWQSEANRSSNDTLFINRKKN